MTQAQTEAEVAEKFKRLLIHYFNIEPNQFSWEKPLEALQKDFKILGYLVFLEQLIHQQFNEKIPIMENVSTAFHTPKDILSMIMREI